MSAGSEDENIAVTRGRSKAMWAILNASVLVVLAFALLFTGHIEGGAFVSLLTLALLVGLLTLFGDRIYQVSLFGSEIRLRRIEQDAAVAIRELRRSRIDAYRTSLHLSSPAGGRPATQGNHERPAEALIEVVRMIHDAELTGELANEIVAACRKAEARLSEGLGRHGAPGREGVLARHDSVSTTEAVAGEDDTHGAAGDLRELVRLRQQAELHL